MSADTHPRQSKRQSQMERAREMHAADPDLTYGEIAAAIGISQTTAYRWCNPDYDEHQRAMSRSWKERNRGSCVDCGAPTNASSGTPCERCTSCARAKQRAEATWTRERIIQEGHRWHALTGRWPVTGDWNRFQNRGERRRLIDEFHALTGPWPHTFVIQRQFGTWRAFIEALGGEAHPHHWGGVGMSKKARTDELRRLVEAAA